MSELRTEGGAASASTNYLRILREQWKLVAATVIICVFGGLIGRQIVPTSYKADTDLTIQPIDDTNQTYVGIDIFRNTSSDPTSNVLTLARYVDTAATAQVVKQRLHLRQSATSLLRSITVTPLSQTSIVTIQAKASSPKFAATLADAFADATIARRTQQVQSDATAVIDRLQTQIARSSTKSSVATAALQTRLATLRSLLGLPDPTVAVLNRAEVPTTPDKPSKSLVVIATALAGLLLGFGIGVLYDSIGGKIRREDELLLKDRIPVLARVPRMSESVLQSYMSGRDNLPPAAWEAYRTLRTNILRSPAREHGRVVLVTSAAAGEGKTLTAVNLAITLAAQGSQVLLVDGDFRRPMLASIFRIAPPRDGFGASFVRGNIAAATQAVPGYDNLRLMLPSLANMAQIDQLDAERVEQLFERLRREADVIVVDSAPATEVSEPLLLASAADLTLVAVRLGHTRRSRFDGLRESLAQYGVAPGGLVVTTRQPPDFTMHGSSMPVPVELRTTRPRREQTARERAIARAKRSR
jgi:Mrp family chromosome partitioning ATPase/capsular polysaccharide biosynthesis protein